MATNPGRTPEPPPPPDSLPTRPGEGAPEELPPPESPPPTTPGEDPLPLSG